MWPAADQSRSSRRTPATAARRHHAELGEDVRQVALDGLLAQEQLGGDLSVGLALGHVPGDLELPTAQPQRAGPVTAPSSRHTPAEPAEFTRRLVRQAHGTAGQQVGFGALQVDDRVAALLRLCERTPREGA